MQMIEQPKRTNLVDMRTLYRTAQQAGFPRFTVLHNGKRLDVMETSAGWKTALPTLDRKSVV